MSSHQSEQVAAYDPWAHRRGEPRTFAALWLLIILLTLVTTLGGLGALGLTSTDVYRPAASRLMVSLCVGVVVLWPVIRLSQERAPHPVRATLMDLVIVLLPVVAFVWPQAMSWMAGWPLEVCACVCAWVCAWGVLVGCVLCAWQMGVWASRGWTMAGLLALVLGGAIVAALLPVDQPAGADLSMMLSPLTGAMELTRSRAWTGQATSVEPAHWWCVAAAWGAAGAGWLGVAKLPNCKIVKLSN